MGWWNGKEYLIEKVGVFTPKPADIDELNTGIVKRYIEHKQRSFGKKKNMLDTFKTLWAFAKDNNLFGDIIPQDPTKDITFKRPEVSRSPGSIYNERRFTDEEIAKMLSRKEVTETAIAHAKELMN